VTDAAPAQPSPPAAVPASRIPLRTGAAGWRVRHVQERLTWLGYDIVEGNLTNERMGESTTAAVKRFQSKFGFRPTGVVGPGTYGLLNEIAGKVGRLPAGCMGDRAICIDKAQRLVRLVEKDEVVLTLDARFGFVGAETREGTFRIERKSRDHTSSLYRTWMPFALFFSGGQAVHYSPYFARDGYNGGSHGCVNLRDFDRARWLFDQVAVGTRVHVYRS
jgi:peptidoglycan hydrolase-like protein with peptidoglycan-binding domain